VEEELGRTYDAPSKGEQDPKRIQRHHDYPRQRGEEPSRYSNESDNEDPEADEDLEACFRGCRAIGLVVHEVACQTEDEDAEDDLWRRKDGVI